MTANFAPADLESLRRVFGRPSHVRNRRCRQLAQHRSDPDRRLAPPRIPRLRLLRRRPAPGRRLRRARSTARVAELAANVEADQLQGGTGIAHTRWATHGAPVVNNAHPHFSHGPRVARRSDSGEASGIAAAGRIGLVHNGIIENHEELRAELQAAGYVFVTQTDTEVIAHLVDRLLRRRPARGGAAHRAAGCAAPSRSRCSAATSRTAWSARARARR